MSELPPYSGSSSLRTAAVSAWATAAIKGSAGKLTVEEDAVPLMRCSAGASDIADGMLVASIRTIGVEVSLSVSVDVD